MTAHIANTAELLSYKLLCRNMITHCCKANYFVLRVRHYRFNFEKQLTLLLIEYKQNDVRPLVSRIHVNEII